MKIRAGWLSLGVTLGLLGAGACVPEETSIDMERGPEEVERWRGGEERESETGDEEREGQTNQEGSQEAKEAEEVVDELRESSRERAGGHNEEIEVEASESLDLSCSSDPGVCKFCGPPVHVKTSCPESDDSFECQVFRLVNERRLSAGLSALNYDGKLAESAQLHAMDLSLCDYFAHDSLDGTTFFERCAANGYEGSCTGENIGGGQQTPQSVVDAWMASPSHRDNILYPYHEEMGVGFYVGDGGYQRYWVKHFGRP